MPGSHQVEDPSGTLAGADDGADGRRPSPEQTLLSRERRQEIGRALAKLPERQRAVFVLSHVEGHTSREVSAMTGLNESTVRVHLFRAIRKLRTLLAPDGMSAPAAVGEGKRRVTS